MDWIFDIDEYEYDNKKTVFIVENNNRYYVVVLYNKKFKLLNSNSFYYLNTFSPVRISLDELSTKNIIIGLYKNNWNNKTTLMDLKEQYNTLIVGIDISLEEIKNNFE